MKANGTNADEQLLYYRSRVVWLCSKPDCSRQRHNGKWGPPQPIGPHQPRMREMCDECKKSNEPSEIKVMGGGQYGTG